MIIPHPKHTKRRVFYIDVGNMPADRVKKYLDDIRREIQQRK